MASVQSTQGTMTSTSVGFSSISTATRYMGMIEESGYKKSRNALFVLFDYVAATAPTFFFVHSVVTVWRVIQILGPALAVQYTGFWGTDTVMKKVMDIISISFHLIPGFAREGCAVYILYSFSALFLISFVFIFSSAAVLNKLSKLPTIVTTIIAFWFASFGYILPPIAVNLAGEMIGQMFYNTEKANAVNIIAIIFTALILLIFIWIYNSIYSVSITFKPDSLMSAVPALQTLMFTSNIIITFLTALASQLSQIPSIVITVICIIGYLVSIVGLFSKGGLVNYNHVKCVAASYLSGALLLILVIIFELANIEATEIVLVVFTAVWFICFFFFSFTLNRKMVRVLNVLDSLEEDINNFESVKSPRILCDYIVNGFRVAHPFALSWQIFKCGVEKWPKNVEIWLLFAKFTAIYPEEQQQMVFISMGIIQNKLKGSLAKHTMQQILSIMKQRETNLVPDLKSKLDKVGKQVQSTKHKVRYTWDLVLQGNIKEIESVISHAHKAIDTCEAEFNHFLGQFPNNRFIARAYARFLRDVVADHAGHKQWAQNVSTLQRGQNVKQDQAHILGIRAFPQLPKMATTILQQTHTTAMALTDDTLTQEIETDEEKAAIDAELRMSVRESINNLSIPAFKIARALRIITILILFVAPVIALTVYIPLFIDDIATPLDFLYDISLMRTRAFQVTANAHHFIAERIHLEFNESTPIENADRYAGTLVFPMDNNSALFNQEIEEPPEFWGNTYDTGGQLDHMLQSLADILPGLAKMNSFKKGDASMDEVRECIFGDMINFTFISNPHYKNGFNLSATDPDYISYNTTYQMVSAREAISEYIVLLRQLIDNNESISEDAMSQKYMSIPLNNLRTITDYLRKALEVTRNYVISSDKTTAKYVRIIMIVIIIAVLIIYISCNIIISVITAKEKKMIYRCLTSLPKNVVSRVADSFKILKKDEDDEECRTSYTRDEELNKQEENMLKLFSTSSDSSRGSSNDDVIFAIFTVIVTGLQIATTAIICNFLINMSEQLMHAAPHIDFIMASYSYDLATVLLLNMLPASIHPYVTYHVNGYDTKNILNFIFEWQELSNSRYQAVRYGDDTLDAVPFSSIGIDVSAGESDPNCVEDVPIFNHQIYNCWTSDLLTSFVQMEVNALIHKFNMTGEIYPGDSVFLTHIWHIHQVHIYNQYFAPMFSEIIPMVLSSMNKQVPKITGVSYALLAIAIIFEIAFIVVINMSEERQKFALRLLLHCPGNVVVSNSHITAILAGNFSLKHIDSTTRDAEFYDVLVKDLPDSVIICDLMGNIISANVATGRVYGLDIEQLVNTPISDLGKQIFGDDNPFQGIPESQQNSFVGFEKNFEFKRNDGNIIHVVLSLSMVHESLIVSTRDITQTVMYNKLISDERAKSDKLLSSILPARLVPRVQAGEKNISFAVQTASIVFMDIVSFTPWCGSLEAAQVMKTLNMLFKELDALVAAHPTMTKIKCIGDCYMAAGGLFMEINQPAQHAKDVVDFGLDAIDALQVLNVEIEQDLKIRVGVNTGGPIVAGVLGTEKPTFEILGPTINMAQQMEHHGVPMKVHVSRAVYELIYGGNFDVKERGEIEIKGGNVVTYIVQREKASSA
ncbi:Adenylate and Guanylate cyclase catalytic domain containing protein [Tritrichomonas foetus]|uniref:Adenylate and Guanylate cyclase catalytic domain containing protein n=1 Tax=Tritrichomonas foetus TaxID=1144522 RepID=A0A1J4KAE3_9EUKA|nr:Adenylate and Guanylate cyclase catalytic domain containing protein [Tritrichomonas foetus]|eukprot:OHT07880.1 Adenylate and Guanylate cyclase catalytic domain containing protein [Tritrichomonas foetus]